MSVTHWNYRVIKRIYDTGEAYDIGEAYYTICEVFYDEGGSVNLYSGPKSPRGETLDDLKENLSFMQIALNKPVLDEKDLTASDEKTA